MLERTGDRTTIPFGAAACMSHRQQYLREAVRHHLRLPRAADLRGVRRVGRAGPVQLRRLAYFACRRCREGRRVERFRGRSGIGIPLSRRDA